MEHILLYLNDLKGIANEKLHPEYGLDCRLSALPALCEPVRRPVVSPGRRPAAGPRVVFPGRILGSGRFFQAVGSRRS